MSATNSFTLIGWAKRISEIRHTPSGKAVIELDLAFPTGTAGKPFTSYQKMTCWEFTAQYVAQYVKEGDRIATQGEIAQDEFTDKETGNQRRIMKFTAQSVRSLEQREKNEQVKPSQQRPQRETQPATAHDDGEEIPF